MIGDVHKASANIKANLPGNTPNAQSSGAQYGAKAGAKIDEVVRSLQSTPTPRISHQKAHEIIARGDEAIVGDDASLLDPRMLEWIMGGAPAPGSSSLGYVTRLAFPVPSCTHS